MNGVLFFILGVCVWVYVKGESWGAKGEGKG